MRTERTQFSGSQGQSLAARLDLPDGHVEAYALFAHCFTCGKDVIAASWIAQTLTLHRIGVLRFDFTGIGASEGTFELTNFSSNIADLVAAANYLRGRFLAPSLLVGHSLGGAAVLAAAENITEARAVATIAAPSAPSHVLHLFREKLDAIRSDGEAEVQLAGRTFRIKHQFLLDLAEHSLSEKIATMRKALLVMHSPQDAIVDIGNALRIFSAAKHPKSFVSLDDADHLLSRREDAIYAAQVIAAWCSRYLGP